MMDVRVGNDRRKQLLQQLFAKFSGGLQQQGTANPALAFGMRPSSSNASLFTSGAAGRGAAPFLTHPDETPTGLEALLGPGGYGSGGIYDQSSAEGAPVERQTPTVYDPGPQGPSVPLEPNGPVQQQQQAPLGVARTSMPGPGVGTAPIGGTRTLVPLGNGMYFDPATNSVQGIPAIGHGRVVS